jgi:ubiquinol-cytochrome c reductase iron-sulfur subunit
MTVQLPLEANSSDRSATVRREEVSRRSLLYTATTLFGAAGVVAAALPLVDQMNPDAATRAMRDETAVDVADLKPDQQRVIHWRNFPIVIAQRSEATLAWLHEHPAGLRPPPPILLKRRQPSSAENFSRSIDPGFGVFASMCTWCRCAPLIQATAIEPDIPGSFMCVCCASRFDAAGRPTYGPAQRYLLVPPYAREESRIVIGKSLVGEPVPSEFFNRVGWM